jgi:hypothetical protein
MKATLQSMEQLRCLSIQLLQQLQQNFISQTS